MTDLRAQLDHVPLTHDEMHVICDGWVMPHNTPIMASALTKIMAAGPRAEDRGWSRER